MKYKTIKAFYFQKFDFKYILKEILYSNTSVSNALY